NYDGARPCDYSWVKALSDECREANTTFAFFGIGNDFVKDGKHYHLDSNMQKLMAYKSNFSFKGREFHYNLHDSLGFPIRQEDMYVPYFSKHCDNCPMRITCNGCSRCGKCKYI
ncbi:MAG: hypothetical protein K6G51_03050, partial [Sphaerochaetaceae bacterium]|nr:hypothetical protein [Sphaerochaetaceae bacterium]